MLLKRPIRKHLTTINYTWCRSLMKQTVSTGKLLWCKRNKNTSKHAFTGNRISHHNITDYYSIRKLPFNIFAFQDDSEKINVVGQTDGSQYPEDGVPINAWEWFVVCFLFTCITVEENETQPR